MLSFDFHLEARQPAPLCQSEGDSGFPTPAEPLRRGRLEQRYESLRSRGGNCVQPNFKSLSAIHVLPNTDRSTWEWRVYTFIPRRSVMRMLAFALPVIFGLG